MLKNREIKRLLQIEVVLLVVFIGLMLLNNHQTYQKYQKIVIRNNDYILGTILERHPELESELIDILLESPDPANSYSVLSKYGLDRYENLNQIIDLDSVKYQILYYDVIYLSVFLGILMIIFYCFVRHQYRKMRGMTDYMNAILHDDYTLDIRSYEEGDISNLKNDIYKVTVKLKTLSDRALAGKKSLESTLSDISHQIRTPLTSMYVINDLLSNEELDPKVKKEFLAKNRNQLERMEWLVTSLLKLSRLESGTILLKPKECAVNDLIQKALEPVTIPMELKNIELAVDCPSDIVVAADFNWTVEALINIIKNACEHTPEGGRVTITGVENPIYTEICIRDTGEGIDPKELPHIFERFYKGKHNKESIGIGLNMSKKIIDMQKGDIVVESIPQEYTAFRIKFYKNIL